MTTAKDIMKQIKDNDVKFVDLRFTDPKGKLQHVTMDVVEYIGLNQEDKTKRVPFTGLSMGEATSRILQFIQKKELSVILVIDEIDSLVDKSGDDILYSFTRANQQMVEGGFIALIGISNSLDFKDKLDPAC